MVSEDNLQELPQPVASGISPVAEVSTRTHKLFGKRIIIATLIVGAFPGGTYWWWAYSYMAPEAMIRRARIARESGDLSEAEQILRSCIRRNNYARAKERLLNLLNIAGEYDEVILAEKLMNIWKSSFSDTEPFFGEPFFDKDPYFVKLANEVLIQDYYAEAATAYFRKGSASFENKQWGAASDLYHSAYIKFMADHSKNRQHTKEAAALETLRNACAASLNGKDNSRTKQLAETFKKHIEDILEKETLKNYFGDEKVASVEGLIEDVEGFYNKAKEKK